MKDLDEEITFAEEDDSGPGSSEGLVDRRGDDVTEREGGWDYLGRHQPGDVSHVGHQHRATAVGDLAEAGVVQVAGVARDSGDDEPRTEQL